MTPPLTVEKQLLDGPDGRSRGRVVAVGEIDASSAPQLADALDQLLESGADALIVDATDVTFLDSSGLRVLVRASKTVEAQGGTVVLDGMSPAVQRILEVTGLLEAYRPATG